MTHLSWSRMLLARETGWSPCIQFTLKTSHSTESYKIASTIESEPPPPSFASAADSTGVENQTPVSACLLLLLFPSQHFIEITKEQETCQRAESREREAFKLARAQPENRKKQKRKGRRNIEKEEANDGDWSIKNQDQWLRVWLQWTPEHA